MLKVLFQVLDFLVKAIVEFAQTEEGRAEFDDIQRELRALGVPIDEDDTPDTRPESEQLDLFDDVDWLQQLNQLTPQELRNIEERIKSGGGVTPAVEVDERLTAHEFSPVKDPARFLKKER